MQAPVIFRKMNNIYGRVECQDFDFIIELRDYLTFEVEGHQFMPSFKVGAWDGKIRLLEIDGQCYLGLWSMIKKFCENEGRQCFIDPNIHPIHLDFDRFNRFVDSLNVHSDGDPIDPYDYQREAAHWALQQKRCLLLSPTSSGKAQPLYSKIMTPIGWTTMGDIEVGDMVSTPDGQYAKVIATHPQTTQKKIYEITTVDGRVTRACAEHLWSAYCDERGDWNLYTTEELLASDDVGKYILPLSVVEHNTVEHVIHPHILGSIISGESSLTMFDDELDRLGILHDKYIPDEFIHDSLDNRYSLLSAIMCPYGACDGVGKYYYTNTTSKKLADSLRVLVRSMGGIATIDSKDVGDEPLHTVWSYVPNKDQCTNLRGIHIQSIEFIGCEDAKCITIDSADQLYVTDDYVVTHNSMIQYILCRMYEVVLPNPDDKILLIVPRANLVSQMYGDFGDYSSEVDWDVSEHCHMIKGTKKDTNKKLTITTYQSLTNKKTRPPKEWFKQFKAVMVDEVHKATSESVMYILEACTEAEWKVGLTGTFDESKTHEYTLRGLFGDVKKVITTKELMDAGRVANLSIKVGLLQYPDHVRRKMRNFTVVESKGKKKKVKATYADEMSYITNSWERNKFLMSLAASLSGNTILMINQVEHGENLFKWMRQVYPDRKIYLYTGRVKDDERDHIKAVMEHQDNAIIIGSLGVLSTGISIKRLDNLIFAHPTKSKVWTLQSVGRILRRCKYTDNNVTMYDIIDCFNAGSYENYTYDHGQNRVRFYDQEQFKYEVINVPIEVPIDDNK